MDAVLLERRGTFLLEFRDDAGTVDEQVEITKEAAAAIEAAAKARAQFLGVPHGAITNVPLGTVFGIKGWWKKATCYAWKFNALYWQLLAALYVAKKTKLIRSRKACQALAKAGTLASTLQLGPVGGAISKDMGRCACKDVF